MPDETFAVMLVECPHCRTIQDVHVTGRLGFSQVEPQTIRCVNAKCGREFEKYIPDRIIRGPLEHAVPPEFEPFKA
jgi:phage FluMu protein Com